MMKAILGALTAVMVAVAILLTGQAAASADGDPGTTTPPSMTHH